MDSNFSNSQTQFSTINSVKVAFRHFGQGEPILFYNRFRGILDTWDPLFLDTLSQKNSIVLFDYPGIGESEGELSSDISEVAAVGVKLMENLGIHKFHAAGWSYGGLVAQTALFMNREKVAKAVLIGTNPPGINEVPFDKTFFEKALKPVNDLEDETVAFFEPSSEKSRAASKASFDRIALKLDRTKIPSTSEQFQKYFEGSAMMKKDIHDYRGQYKTLKNPVLVISADHDISFAVENWFPLLRHAPSMQHIIINDAGHGLQHQEPVLIANYIKLFLS
ncbi:alpha/beta hydrolase [Flavobacterium crocinum]|uniref:Alpha/beta hydrolase n=1 Tax=Flavobacterium crocinum TaxID=2183896 RepID=A0A2S1YKZ4_9FLAO|nr:alpha/beta hydrolase [Flavobacterium crocinum]AWK04751.1 alpha/beta hydrolase [Flavobacterium crocinum]